MNILAISVAVILNMVIGMIWYSALFGTRWATALKFDVSQLKARPQHFIGAILVSIVTVVVTAILINMFQITTLSEAIKLGLLLWLGFIATTHFSGVIWAQKPLVVYFIDVGCLLVITLVNTVLLTLWR